MSEHGGKKLGWFLCWAVVFADIGTSLYYVPGIMFGNVGNLAGLFVALTSLVFILLALKYIEITDRYPEGGGVVTVATHAFGPWFGALGGMFITVDYFLTAAISSVSGFAYLNSIVHITPFITLFAVIGIILLGLLNIVGIKESAGVTSIIAVAAFIVDMILLAFVVTQIGPAGWQVAIHSFTQIKTLTPFAVLTGFAGSFLAFSGLESISQLSPAMALPRKKVATIAMIAVILSICLTSPLLTTFATNVLTAKVPSGQETITQEIAAVPQRQAALATTTNPAQRVVLEQQIEEGQQYSDRFISELGAQYGGIAVKIAIVLTASILLLFASNTAIIGSYHVFIALSRHDFLPKFLQKHNTKFGTPHWSVFVSVTAPILILIATKGNVDLLGELYAFGLLGAFALSSLGLDIVRWREGRRFDPMFLLGLITTGLVILAWCTNLYNKRLATEFGGAITLAGMCLAYVMWKFFPSKVEVGEIALTPANRVKKGQILVPVYGEFDPSLFAFVAHYAKSANKIPVVLYIREFSDILQTVSESITTDEEAEVFINQAKAIFEKLHVPFDVLYDTATDTGQLINEYRKKYEPMVTILSPHAQSLMLDFMKGNIVESVMSYPKGNVLIHMGDDAAPGFGKQATKAKPAAALNPATSH